MKRAHVATPRLASLDFMRAPEHTLAVSTSVTLKAFDAADALSLAVVGDGIVTFPGPLRLDPHGVPPVLVLASDHGPQQLCGANYLKYKLGLCIEHLGDPPHIGSNATEDAMMSVGMQPVVECGLLICNVV